MEEELSSLVPTLSFSDAEVENFANHGGFRFGIRRRLSEIFNRIRNIPISIEKHTVYCFAMVFLFWCFASLLMNVGGCKPQNIWMGPNSSILVVPNPFWVQSIKVNGFDDSEPGLELLGFYNPPPLDVIANWSESRILSISPRSFKGWPYYLNNGSSLNISYRVKSEGSSAILVVEKGLRHFSQSSEEPKYVETALSVNLIQGSGVIEMKISEASTYFFAVSNLNLEEVKVELNIDVRAVLYDTKNYFYKCTFSDGICQFAALSFLEHSFVLTSPALRQGASVEGWYIKFSYQPRWNGFVITAGIVICFLVVALQFAIMLVNCLKEYDSASSQRRHLLANKDDDGSSMCSSLTDDDDADLENFMGNGDEATRRRCVICFNAPRDCFFFPCGHCVSCYQCGTKVAETGGSCPICRRRIKKVKRIFRV